MAISNGSFEIGTGVVGEAQDWTSICSTAVSIAGFGDTEDPLEIFNWIDLYLEISGVSAVFNFPLDPVYYDEFYWGSGDFYEEWYSGWTTIFEDDMIWEFLIDIFIDGSFTGYEDFIFGSFNDTWSGGLVAEFADDTIGVPVPYESFNDSDWH